MELLTDQDVKDGVQATIEECQASGEGDASLQHLVEIATVVNRELPNAKQVIRSPANQKGQDHSQHGPEVLTGDQAQVANAHC